MKRLKNKEHYQSFLIKKISKTIANNYLSIKNIVDVNSVIIEHPKTSHKSFKTVAKGGKVGSNSSLYSDTKKVKSFWTKKI